jgi:hypothetical protein
MRATAPSRLAIPVAMIRDHKRASGPAARATRRGAVLGYA